MAADRPRFDPAGASGDRVYSVPYGSGSVSFRVPAGLCVTVVEPPEAAAAPDPLRAVEAALDAPVGGVGLEGWRGARSAAIAVNDKTRPVPHHHLLPPLLSRLESLGLAPEAIRFLIATGTHPPMLPHEFGQILPAEVLERYPVQSHDADDWANLVSLGGTSRGTPVWANRLYLAADLRIVVGNVEPHIFQGFSGSVKSAAIGLAGRETVDHNHSLLVDPRAVPGRYADNPARQDVEEIGRLFGVHLALNAVLNGRREIVRVFAGEPRAVMEAAIPASRRVCEVAVGALFDLVIASAGGHPRDLNLYQAQKALAHSAPFVRDGGAVILVAACREAVGSQGYETWMEGMASHEEVLARFAGEGFRVGPHKAFLVARDAVRLRVFLVSEMDGTRVRRLLLTPAATVEEALAMALPDLERGDLAPAVGVLPRAPATSFLGP